MRSRSFGPLRRAVTVMLCSGVITGGLVALASPQAAASTSAFLGPTSTALVDSAAPHTRDVTPASIPVGTHVDAGGVAHTTKGYFTFDLSRLVGHELLGADFDLPETAVADCSVPTTPQAWLTSTDTSPTFADPPKERVELAGPGRTFGCPDSAHLEWDATAALRQVLAAGHRTATIELRLADADQSDPAHGLTFDPAAALRLRFDILPARPTGLTVNGTACADRPLPIGNGFTLTLGATVTDPDDTFVDTEFDWWPVADPAQRTEIDSDAPSGSVARVTLLLSQLADDTAYAWQVRGVEANQSGQQQQVDGPFSAVCEFTTDFTPPATAPTITSTDYPPVGQHGGEGVPGTFTFSGNGDPDVTGFVVEPDFTDPIPANKPGGVATFQFTPQLTGPKSITVHSVDRAGNIGASTTYQFFVASNAPTVSCSPQSVFVGQRIQCTFTDPDRITGYRYEFGLDPAVTVPADSHGTASVTLNPTDPSGVGNLVVQAVLANGNLSARGFAGLTVDPGAPTVDQSADEVVFGSPVMFTFHAVLPGSVSFTYVLNGENMTTVPVGADGTATVTVRPTESGSALLDVFSTTAAGQRSGSTDVFFQVDSNSPTVTSADYPPFTVAGGVGDPGTFTFSPTAPGVVGYTYSFNGGDPLTVPAGADGGAQVTLTPTDSSGFQTLVVTSTFADGTVSDRTEYDFFANTTTPGVTCAGQVGRGEIPSGAVTCVLSPVQENVASYVYTVNGGDPVTVAAGPDGSATITLDAESGTSVVLTARSRNAAGDSSDQTTAVFDVVQPAQAQARVVPGAGRG